MAGTLQPRMNSNTHDAGLKEPQFLYQAYASGLQIVLTLWSQMGAVKRAQALAAVEKLQCGNGLVACMTESELAESPDAFFVRDKLAWAAGFFDAEGCFSYTPRIGVCASITNTDLQWKARREGKGNSTAEPAIAYLIA